MQQGDLMKKILLMLSVLSLMIYGCNRNEEPATGAGTGMQQEESRSMDTAPSDVVEPDMRDSEIEEQREESGQQIDEARDEMNEEMMDARQEMEETRDEAVDEYNDATLEEDR